MEKEKEEFKECMRKMPFVFDTKDEMHIIPEMEIRLKKVEKDILRQIKPEDYYDRTDPWLEGMKELAMETLVSINMIDGIPVNYCICAIGTQQLIAGDGGLSNVLKAALLSNASSVLILHNHPNQKKAVPSYEDMKSFWVLTRLLNLVNIDVYDVVIIGEENYFCCKAAFPEYFKLEECEWKEMGQLLPDTVEEFIKKYERYLRENESDE